jgi:hypothetical protein
MSDSSSEADTKDYEPHEQRYLEADEWMEDYGEAWNDNNRRKLSEVIRARIAQQASPYTTTMATMYRDRDQRMIMLFALAITLCAPVLSLQSAFNCTCNPNF